MKQRFYWPRRILLAVLVLAFGAVVGLKWLVPRYLIRTLERVGGGTLIIDQTRVTFLLTTTLAGLRLANNSAESALSVTRVVMTPQWFSPFSRTLWVDTLDIEEPLVRLTRAKDGTTRLPAVIGANGAGRRLSLEPGSWTIRVNSLNISSGVIEFVDEKPQTPFHGALEHLSLTVGPVIITVDQDGVSIAPTEDAVSSFAVRAKVIGDGGASAPIYCSGWVDRSVKALQASCSLEPLALSAFDPYYHGRREFRVYAATLASTSRWSARANQLTGRLQLEFSNLSEGDLSIRGRTIIDIKEFTDEPDPRLRGEISFTGPLDSPQDWHAEFLPGDDTVRAMVTDRLLEYGVKMVRFPFLRVSLTRAMQETMPDIEAASREVQEALEMLARPIPVAPPVEKLYGPWPSLEEYAIYEELKVEVPEVPTTPEEPSSAVPEPEVPAVPDTGTTP